jgi:hypothetical protein
MDHKTALCSEEGMVLSKAALLEEWRDSWKDVYSGCSKTVRRRVVHSDFWRECSWLQETDQKRSEL